MPANTDQIILGELRAVRRDLSEISLSLRVDTTWTVAKEHVRYLVETIRIVPLAARILALLAIATIGAGVVYRQSRVTAIGVDLFMLALVCVGSNE